MDAEEKWYTVKQFAQSFGQYPNGKPSVMGVDTVRRRIRAGKIRALKLPRKIGHRNGVYDIFLISEAERQRFIRSNSTS